jgi:hypothetical protein
LIPQQNFCCARDPNEAIGLHHQQPSVGGVSGVRLPPDADILLTSAFDPGTDMSQKLAELG